MRTAPPIRKSTSRVYVERVNAAIDHIVANLDRPLRLTALARVAHMSSYHFHRVFHAIVGEPPGEFVKRLRLERALERMARPGRPSLTRVALACGFASSSDFSRCFRQRYGVAPSRFDVEGWRERHRERLEALAGAGAARDARGGAGDGGAPRLRGLGVRTNPDALRVRLRELPARTVAYIRVRDPYRAGAVVQAVERLCAWAQGHDLAGGQWLGYQWENPEIVALERCRYHAAVVVPEGRAFTASGEVGRWRFPPMLVAQVEIRGGIDLELRAMRWLYGQWLPRSGYEPDDQPAFEAWIGRPFACGLDHFELHIQVPVRALRGGVG